MTTATPPNHGAGVRPEPHWPYLLTIIVAVSLHYALPSSLRVWPPWLGGAIGLTLAGIGYWTANTKQHALNQHIGYILATGLTVAVVYGVVRLVIVVLMKSQPPIELLRSAVILWPSNIITFAVWYWRLDAGGPLAREQIEGGPSVAFLFPQMTLHDAANQRWRPHFMDYLFLAFNTSTAFSPTDVPILSRWAKMLSMTESIISLTILIILVARAINGL